MTDRRFLDFGPILRLVIDEMEQSSTELRAAKRAQGRFSPSASKRPSRVSVKVKLSILMPAYNEAATLENAVREVLGTEYPCEVELVIVNDGSTDATALILDGIEDPRVRVHHHTLNRGKGAALLTAADQATGTHMVPFDADCEYLASDVARMLDPILSGRADVVYGTRIFGVNTVYQSYRLAFGNRVLTQTANVLFDSYLSDMHTCLKLVPLELFHSFGLRETGFGLDTEITAKLLKSGVRPFEVPISYYSRTYEQGKKISTRHGFECLKVMARVRFSPKREVPVQAPVRSVHRGDVVRLAVVHAEAA
jgi:glycosyltransferase involved in cell wall biosynthesis